MTTARVQCPASSCGAIHEVAGRRLGRNMYCPDCGKRMTARPIEVDRLLATRRPRPAAGRPAASVVRLPLTVLVDNVRSLWNVGSILRTADACAVERVVLCGITGCPPDPRIAKTALGAEQVVRWEYRDDALAALNELRCEGYRTVAVENAPTARPLPSLEPSGKTCLVVGNEVTGVSAPLLDACHERVYVPMLGVKESLNVAVAFGITAHHVASALLSHVPARVGS